MKTVVVLALGRSGTSLLAGVLHKLGVDMGDDGEETSSRNPWGYFENKDFIEFNRDFCREACGNWKIKFLGWDKRIQTQEELLPYFEKYEERAKKLVEKYQKEPIWGWKESRTIMTYPLFFKFCKNIHIIVIHRNLEDHAKSLSRISGIDIDKAKQIIKNYYRRVDQIKGYPRLDVNFEDFFAKPDETVQKIIDFLKINPTPEQIKEAREHIKI